MIKGIIAFEVPMLDICSEAQCMFLHPSSWLVLWSMFVLRQQLFQWEFGQNVLSRILLEVDIQ